MIVDLPTLHLAEFLADGYLLPELIPENWVNTTWRNDSCPSWQAGLLRIYVDHPVRSKRDGDTPFQYGVSVLSWNPVDGVVDDGSPATALETNVWAEVLAYVNDNQDLANMRSGGID